MDNNLNNLEESDTFIEDISDESLLNLDETLESDTESDLSEGKYKTKMEADDEEDDGEGLDKPGSEDSDIDNDGDSDESDEYLKNRRKTITKAMKKEDVELEEGVFFPKYPKDATVDDKIRIAKSFIANTKQGIAKDEKDIEGARGTDGIIQWSKIKGVGASLSDNKANLAAAEKRLARLEKQKTMKKEEMEEMGESKTASIDADITYAVGSAAANKFIANMKAKGVSVTLKDAGNTTQAKLSGPKSVLRAWASQHYGREDAEDMEPELFKESSIDTSDITRLVESEEDLNEKLKVTKVSDDEYEYTISTRGIKRWQTNAQNPNDVRPFVKTIISDIQKFNSDHEYVAFLKALIKHVKKESTDRYSYNEGRRDVIKDLSKSLSKASVAFESKIDNEEPKPNWIDAWIAKVSAKIVQIAAGDYDFTVFLSALVKHLKTLSGEGKQYNQLYKDIDKASKIFYKELFPEEAYSSEDITRLIESEDGLTEEFKDKAAIIFEAAVSSKVNEIEATLVEQYETRLSEEVESLKSVLEEQVDSYLTYAVESWMEENKVAVESSLRTQLAENFISALKTVFVENYVDVPDSKVDLFAQLEAENDNLKEETAKFSRIAESLADRVDTLVREQIVNEAANGLADTQVDRLKKLVEDIEFVDEATYRKKVATIKEFYLNSSQKTEDTTLTEETDNSFVSTETIVEGESMNNDLSPEMKSYLTALSRMNKAVTSDLL